jgi:hypothetical protein
MNAQESIVWAKEGMQLSLVFLAIRLGLKQVTIEERAELKARAARYEQFRQEMNQNVKTS